MMLEKLIKSAASSIRQMRGLQWKAGEPFPQLYRRTSPRHWLSCQATQQARPASSWPQWDGCEKLRTQFRQGFTEASAVIGAKLLLLLLIAAVIPSLV